MNLTRGFRLPNTNKGISKLTFQIFWFILHLYVAVRYSDNSKNKTNGGIVEPTNPKKDDRQRGGDQNRRNDRPNDNQRNSGNSNNRNY